MVPPQSVYIHVPFCRHRCGYCNFTVVAHRDHLIDRYLDALEAELQQLQCPRPVRTVFVGGGTPTHLDLPQLHRLFLLVRKWFPWDASAEVSVEANPNDLSREKLALLAQAGVNRLSVGAQSWQAGKLRRLERDHDGPTITQALEWARPLLRSISLDLIFAAPGESRGDWLDDLQRTIAAAPDHISTYGLTYERGTSFWSRRGKGQILPLPEDDERWMYEAAIDCLTAAGWEHYEVSNFARPGHRCRHNEVYWNGQEYYAAGAGAARYVDGRRELNHRSTTTYVRRVLAGQSPVAESESLAPEDRARERLVFGLRRIEGIELDAFVAQTGYSVASLCGPFLQRYCEQGLFAMDGHRLRLTRAGLMVSDAIWPYLLRC